MANLSTDVLVTKVKAASSAATSDVTSDIIDMQDYDGVMFVVAAGAIVSGAVTSILAQQGDDASLTDAATVTGSTITVADDDDNQTFVVDVYKPISRYVRLKIDRGTQNATFSEIFALRYGAREKPVSNNIADTVTAVLCVEDADAA